MEAAAVTSPAPAPPEILRALRELRGQATVGDVVAATGIERERVQQSLRALLESFRGHLAVGEKGDLLYRFDADLLRRDHVSWWSRFRSAARRFLVRAFKVWIMVMLVAYFVLFVALAVAAIVAVMSREGGGGNQRSPRRRGGGGFRIPGFWIWYLFWTPRWRYGQPYYGHRWEKRHGDDRVPFYKKVFAFVFGPDQPIPTAAQRDRDLIRLIRARRGVLTAAELVEHNGLSVPAAQEELARLVGAYAGDVRVSSKGQLVYVFPELMLSAHGRVVAREPDPAWRRLEHPRAITGNSAGVNTAIGTLNGFNLVASATAPWLIFPRLAIAGPLADLGLVWIPLAFSALFFAIPLVRRVRITRDNAARGRRNLRKVLLAPVYEHSLAGRPLSLPDALAHVRRVLTGRTVAESEVQRELQHLLVDFDGDVDADAAGVLRYRFPTVSQEFEAAAELRRLLTLERQQVGTIVYDSGDDAAQRERRELADFDRDLQHRVPAPERVAYVDDFEVVELDHDPAMTRSRR